MSYIDLAAALVAALFFPIALDMFRRRPRWMLIAIMLCPVGLRSCGELFSGRTLNSALGGAVLLGDGLPPLARACYTAELLILSYLGIIGVALMLLRASARGTRELRSLLLLSGLALCCGPLIACVFGDAPGPEVRALVIPLVLVSLSYCSRDYRLIVKLIKTGASFLVLGSVISLAVAPQWALMQGYTFGLISVLPVRLYGIMNHPIQLSAAAVLLFLTEYYAPSRMPIRYVNRAAALFVLVLTQSKMSFVVMLILGLYAAIWAPRAVGFPRALRIVLVLAVILTIAASVYVTVLAGPQGSSIIAELYERSSTLTGRTEIWQITIDTWKRNPVFGNGPNLWGTEFNERLGGRYATWVGMAHNQVIQTLGESGIVGLIGLLFHLIVLIHYSRRLDRASHGYSGAACALLVTLCLTETPLRTFGLHGFTFLYLGAYALFATLPYADTPYFTVTNPSMVRRPVDLPQHVDIDGGSCSVRRRPATTHGSTSGYLPLPYTRLVRPAPSPRH
jgi:exopolysaccharide production protein ExoQ